MKKVFIKDGERVNEGQLLVTVDDEALKVTLAQAQAQWEGDKALADNAATVEARLIPLA